MVGLFGYDLGNSFLGHSVTCTEYRVVIEKKMLIHWIGLDVLWTPCGSQRAALYLLAWSANTDAKLSGSSSSILSPEPATRDLLSFFSEHLGALSVVLHIPGHCRLPAYSSQGSDSDPVLRHICCTPMGWSRTLPEPDTVISRHLRMSWSLITAFVILAVISLYRHEKDILPEIFTGYFLMFSTLVLVTIAMSDAKTLIWVGHVASMRIARLEQSFGYETTLHVEIVLSSWI